MYEDGATAESDALMFMSFLGELRRSGCQLIDHDDRELPSVMSAAILLAVVGEPIAIIYPDHTRLNVNPVDGSDLSLEIHKLLWSYFVEVMMAR